jgi:hypothetical protein
VGVRSSIKLKTEVINMQPGFIEVERLILEGDVTGARQIVDDICKDDPVTYNAVKDRFIQYVIMRNLTKDVLVKKNASMNKREDALKLWKSLFKDVDPI